jgi:hypothetical protein
MVDREPLGGNTWSPASSARWRQTWTLYRGLTHLFRRATTRLGEGRLDMTKLLTLSMTTPRNRNGDRDAQLRDCGHDHSRSEVGERFPREPAQISPGVGDLRILCFARCMPWTL